MGRFSVWFRSPLVTVVGLASVAVALVMVFSSVNPAVAQAPISVSLPVSGRINEGFLVTVSGSNRVYAVMAGGGKLIAVNLNDDGVVKPLTSGLAFNIAGESFLVPLGNDRWANVTLRGVNADADTIEAKLLKKR